MNRKRTLAAAFAVLVTAVVALSVLAGLAGASSKKDTLTGAGSTAVAPLVAQWTQHYSAADIVYGGGGSGAGIAQISARTVDFGASDAPMTPDQFSGCHGCVQIPWAFFATSIPYNVTGVGYGLHLTGPILAGIYLGHITKWNDSRIKAVNKGVNLPDETIVPVYRSDSSGTSYNFTDYLSHVSKEWKHKVGKGTQPAFPVGVGARGSAGVSAKLSSTAGSIGYVDVAYSYKNHLKFAKVRNRAGKFILPSVRSIRAAAAAIKKVKSKTNAITIVDPSPHQPKAYPICTFTWVIVPIQTSKAGTLKPFIHWAVTSGQQYGTSLLFIPLPKPVKQAALRTIKRIHS